MSERERYLFNSIVRRREMWKNSHIFPLLIAFGLLLFQLRAPINFILSAFYFSQLRQIIMNERESVWFNNITSALSTTTSGTKWWWRRRRWWDFTCVVLLCWTLHMRRAREFHWQIWTHSEPPDPEQSGAWGSKSIRPYNFPSSTKWVRENSKIIN